MSRGENTEPQQGAPQFQQGSAVFSPVTAARHPISPDGEYRVLPLSTHPWQAAPQTAAVVIQQTARSVLHQNLGGRCCCPRRGSGELQHLHFLKGWVRFVNSWESGNYFLQSTRSEVWLLLVPFLEGKGMDAFHG